MDEAAEAAVRSDIRRTAGTNKWLNGLKRNAWNKSAFEHFAATGGNRVLELIADE